MKLVPMSELEYDQWAPRSRANYVLEKMRANGLTRVEAEKIAGDDFARILPNGIHSPDNFLFIARNESNAAIGYAWFCVRGADNNRLAFICDILIEQEYRGQGWGRKLMVLIEQEAANRGLLRVGLHVFGDNVAAIQLYRSLGYGTTDIVMEKHLG